MPITLACKNLSPEGRVLAGRLTSYFPHSLRGPDVLYGNYLETCPNYTDLLVKIMIISNVNTKFRTSKKSCTVNYRLKTETRQTSLLQLHFILNIWKLVNWSTVHCCLSSSSNENQDAKLMIEDILQVWYELVNQSDQSVLWPHELGLTFLSAPDPGKRTEDLRLRESIIIWYRAIEPLVSGADYEGGT